MGDDCYLCGRKVGYYLVSSGRWEYSTFPGFINGEYDPVDRFIVMSRKLIDVLLASIVMRRLLFAKILHIFFLIEFNLSSCLVTANS